MSPNFNIPSWRGKKPRSRIAITSTSNDKPEPSAIDTLTPDDREIASALLLLRSHNPKLRFPCCFLKRLRYPCWEVKKLRYRRVNPPPGLAPAAPSNAHDRVSDEPAAAAPTDANNRVSDEPAAAAPTDANNRVSDEPPAAAPSNGNDCVSGEEGFKGNLVDPISGARMDIRETRWVIPARGWLSPALEAVP